MSGSVAGGAGTGIWTTSGSGTFIPNNLALLGTNIPSDADTAAGTETLVLTSTFACIVRDTMVITITPAPTVDAGPNQTVCSKNPDVTLSGTVTIATGGIWKTS